MKRKIVAILVCILLGWLSWKVYLKVRESARAPADRPAGGGSGPAAAVAVAVAPVQTCTIRDVRLFTGTLRPNSEYEVAPKVSGRLASVTVQLGDAVKRGQLVARLDDEEHVRRVEQARAELEVAEANAEKVRLDAVLEDEELTQKVAQAEAEIGISKATVEECESKRNVAEREYARAKLLFDKAVLSQAELEEAEARYLAEKARKDVAVAMVTGKQAALKSAQVRLSETQRRARANEHSLARAQVAQQEAALKSAEVQLGYTRIHADWEGGGDVRYVGERFIDGGAMLSANTSLLNIVDIEKLRAFIHVIERDYPSMKVGQKATITTDAYPDKTFIGTIARISPVLQETSRQARVEVEIPNQELGLKPGMFVRLEIKFAEHENATVVPRSALVNYRDQQGVFLVGESEQEAHFVAVRAGIVNGVHVEVLDPQLSGSVVTLGHHLLSDGAPVIVSTFSLEAAVPEE